MKHLIVMLLVLSAVACNPAAKITVLDADEPYFNGLTSIHTRAVVRNGASKNMTVENATLDFFYRERHLAAAELMIPITLRARSEESIRVDLKLVSESLSNLQTLQRRMEAAPERLSVSVSAQVRYGKVCRNVRFKNVPYSAIIANFEAQSHER